MNSKSHNGDEFYMFSVLKLRTESGDLGVGLVRLTKRSLMAIHLKWDLQRFIYKRNRNPLPISRELKHCGFGGTAVV